MPWVQLRPAEFQELCQRTRVPNLSRRTRDRLEMVRLAAAGFSPPAIAQLLGYSAAPVRFWLKRYLAGGFDALDDQPHRGRPGRLTPVLLQALGALLAKGDRTWTLPQLTQWLEEQHGVLLSADRLGRSLRQAGFSCRRTERSLAHRQDPAQVEAGRAALARYAEEGTPGSGTSAMSTRPASP